ncbi:DUF4249 domain-containing protein [Flagellimonas meridianipacifica]|uniref:Uncharacterized protein DUF4249 n=1 Tax=Flagellimonas meridianipacifica TaxID=1080225 RepID=A0A2T0MAN5_9FLAO|nr:DUF4249 domain-containing protein [Allomuricauda pacifica]PRX54549.1 uncharacterized protein DUF4249 [Allomuricauda pacifica]
MRIDVVSKYLGSSFLVVPFVFSLFFASCVETFEPETEVFESVLIVEAAITNEDKRQQVLLTRTFRLEEDGPNPESSATVRVIDDQQNEFVFEEVEPGRYLSALPFSAVPNRQYQLSIATSDGRTYGSESVSLTPESQILDLYASREENSNGQDGIAILVDNQGSQSGTQSFRFEYEETYQIIAPRWVAVDAVVVRDRPPPAIVILEPKTEEQQVCYNTELSNTIILGDTENTDQNGLTRFPVRFIGRDNFIISHRYSILVRQFAQTREAFAFYETLNEFSSRTESLFSQIQPGFLIGNVFSLESESENVLGFFEVSSVTSRRIFFDYEDFFPGEPLPPYASDCSLEFTPDLLPGSPDGPSPLVQAINSLGQKFVESTGDDSRPFVLVSRPCGDCTALGSNVIPDFWEE